MNLFELVTALQTEEDAVHFFQEKGLLHNPRKCVNGHDMVFQGNRDRWSCAKSTCRVYKPVRSDTWFEGSKLPFQKITFFIYTWCEQYASIKFCEKELGINHCTRVDWANYLREVCAWHLLQNLAKIGGPNITVEVDETLLSKRKNHQGRVYPQQWVFGGYCRQTKGSFLCAVEDRSANTLIPLIQKYVHPGSTVMTDEWRAYGGIGNIPGYAHLTVNHTYNFVDPLTGAHTQGIESTWRSLKYRNRVECGTSRNLTDSYLCEFMWRKRHEDEDLFEKILTHIRDFWPPA